MSQTEKQADPEHHEHGTTTRQTGDRMIEPKHQPIVTRQVEGNIRTTHARPGDEYRGRAARRSGSISEHWRRQVSRL